MKFFVRNEDTNNRWEFKIDADKETLEELLEGNEWKNNGPGKDILSEDWTRRPRGFDVFGLEDNDLEKYVNNIRDWFEEQGIDTDDMDYIVSANADEALLEDYDDEEEIVVDLFDEMYIDDDL